jgi:hypothetical protein
MAPVPFIGGVEPYAGLGARLTAPVVLPGVTTDTTSSGTLNDYAVPAGTSVLRLGGAANRRITGLAVPGVQDRQLLVIENVGTGALVLGAASGSLSANSFYFRGQIGYVMPIGYLVQPGSSRTCIYDALGAGGGGWRVVDFQQVVSKREILVERSQIDAAPTLGFALERYWHDDLFGVANIFPRTGGGGTVTRSATEQGGVITLASSAGAGGFADIHAGDSAAQVTQIANPRTSGWWCYTRAKLLTVTANSRYAIAQVVDASNTHVTGLAFAGTGAGTGTLNASFDGVLVATSWAVESTAYHEFVFFWDGTANWTAIVDGTVVGSGNANLPHTQGSVWWTQAYNNGVATNEQLNVDEGFLGMVA